jgi:hypothetical protein
MSSSLRGVELQANDEELSVWNTRRREIVDQMGPVLDSAAFRRLDDITFLGILSPRYSDVGAKHVKYVPGLSDGSRASHSLAVALLGWDLTRALGLPECAQRHILAWGLLHDIGNWPLSHTAEFAFTRLTDLTPRAIRREMVIGSKSIPEEFRLHDALRASGLDVQWLLGLFEHDMERLSGELRDVLAILASPLTPDAVEGMWRCGRLIEEPVVAPQSMIEWLFRSRTGQLCVRPDRAASVLAFWRSKMRIYESFFNAHEIIELESAWSQTIMQVFPRMSAAESMFVSESDVVARVMSRGLPAHAPFSRYKTPVAYDLVPEPERRLGEGPPLAQLGAIFVSRALVQWT